MKREDYFLQQGEDNKLQHEKTSNSLINEDILSKWIHKPCTDRTSGDP